MAGALRCLLVRAVPLVCAATSSCTSGTQPPAPAVCDATQGSAADAHGLASDDTAFAVALYGPALAAAGGGKNAIVSPYSVSATLTMVDVGAAGETDTQIRSVLHLPGNATAVAPAYAALACEDESDGSSSGNELLIANSLWGQEGTAFESTFLSTLSSGYGAPLQQVDFVHDAAGAGSTINDWVSRQTQAEIPALLQPGDVDAATRLVLVDAVYFKGAWDTGFDPKSTRSQPFVLSDGTAVDVPTMYGSVNAATGHDGGASIVELPYKGGATAMDIFIPDGAPLGVLSDFEATLSPSVVSSALASLGPPSRQNVQLPKFKFTTRLVLTQVLSALGMPDLFDPQKANLSGITGKDNLFVSAVVQQAQVEVDEQGTIAAAAAASSVGEEGISVFEVNQPFLFLIRDTRNGSILFMGHVEDPRSGS